MKREKIAVGNSLHRREALVEVDTPESVEDLQTFLDDEQIIQFAIRGLNIRRQDAFLRPEFEAAWSAGLRGKDLNAALQTIADGMDVSEKGRAGRPRKPPTVVFAEGELPKEGEQLSRNEVLALFASKGINVKEVK